MPALNRQKTAEVVSDKSYVNTDKEVIVARMLGRYDNGIGKSWDDKDHMKFYNDGHTLSRTSRTACGS